MGAEPFLNVWQTIVAVLIGVPATIYLVDLIFILICGKHDE